jgi:uncharacterized membrane protein
MRVQIETEAMPPGNLTDMTDTQRAQIIAWIRAGARVQ